MIFRLSIALCLLLQSALAFAALPFATGDISRSECIDAMTLARAMFQSTAQRLYAPLVIPAGLQSTMVLGAVELDISGGDALTSTDDFERLPQGTRTIYWAKETNGATRVVVNEVNYGWQGDKYSLYLLDAAVAKDDFIKSIDAAPGSATYRSVVSDTWRPPLVFQSIGDKAKWFIDVGEPFQIFSDWRVYSSAEKREICRIAFSPLGKDKAGRLPHAVTSLARKLDREMMKVHCTLPIGRDSTLSMYWLMPLFAPGRSSMVTRITRVAK